MGSFLGGTHAGRKVLLSLVNGARVCSELVCDGDSRGRSGVTPVLVAQGTLQEQSQGILTTAPRGGPGTFHATHDAEREKQPGPCRD